MAGKAGGALQVPRPCQTPPKDKPVKIGVADESRFGWHTQSRRGWSLRGQRVVIPQQQRYEWEHVHGALEVVAGGAQFRCLPAVSWALTQGFLKQIAASDAGAEQMVIRDQAGFHPRPGAASLPARIHLLPLPPYSPELKSSGRPVGSGARMAPATGGTLTWTGWKPR